ncbi:MAG: glycosyltransferase family 39 protein [Candidatus Hydrogenedentes bacterium]|nr:glycosyltransferase family 39 protein [Candidatus Hydrogenedentota bacterium]
MTQSGGGAETESLGNLLRGLFQFLVLSAFVCAGFGASASWGLLAHAALIDSVPTFSGPKLVVKAIAFTVILVTSLWWLLRFNTVPSIIIQEPKPKPVEKANPAALRWLAIILLFVGTVSGIRLTQYPHLEPDEAHHLIVARNLAVHGVYGSGMPATGFRWFDDYDSVGPTVIVPVSLAMWYKGTRIDAGRIVMTGFYVLLTALVYKLLASTLGAGAGLCGALLLLAAPGSIYLARTVYGEAPALAFLIAGLLAWQRALGSPRAITWGVASGMLLGCALVTKYFLVIAVWPALGVLIFDRRTHKKIRPAHVLVPATVALSVLISWLSITSIYGPHGADSTSAYVSEYQHNFLFGTESLARTLGWLTAHAMPGALFLVVGTAGMGLLAVRTHYSPALLFLALFAGLNTFWWVFFTTGNHPRYLWYSLALGAAFVGAQFFKGIRMQLNSVSMAARLTGGVACAIIAALVLWNSLPRVAATFQREEMRSEYAMLDHVQSTYESGTVATTQYTVERLFNLCLEEPVQRVKRPADAPGAKGFIIDATSDAGEWNSLEPRAQFGRYKIVELRR